MAAIEHILNIAALRNPAQTKIYSCRQQTPSTDMRQLISGDLFHSPLKLNMGDNNQHSRSRRTFQDLH